MTPEDICNLALVDKLGADSILSISAPQTPNERRMARSYPHYRNVLLRTYRWNFARRRATLTLAVGDTLDSDRPYRFLLPTDFLSAIRPGGALWALRGKYLWNVDKGDFGLEYTALVDSSEFDPMFCDVLACRLAYELAEPITQSNEKKADAKDKYRESLMAAVKANAFETEPSDIQDSDSTFTWITGRMSPFNA